MYYHNRGGLFRSEKKIVCCLQTNLKMTFNWLIKKTFSNKFCLNANIFSKLSERIVYTNTGHYSNEEVKKLKDATVTPFRKQKLGWLASTFLNNNVNFKYYIYIYIYILYIYIRYSGEKTWYMILTWIDKGSRRNRNGCKVFEK